MSASEKIAVMLVDDHPVVCAGLETIIEAQPDMHVVACARTGEEALEKAALGAPEVILMDLRLPGMSGVETIRRLDLHHTRVIVLTTYEGDEDIHQALQAGAVSYIVKGMPYEVLLRAIRETCRGRAFLPRSVTNTLQERGRSELSARELQVLQLIVAGHTNRAVAEQLGITERTVKFHMAAILAHFGVQDRTQAVVAALRRGYVHF